MFNDCITHIFNTGAGRKIINKKQYFTADLESVFEHMLNLLELSNCFRRYNLFYIFYRVTLSIALPFLTESLFIVKYILQKILICTADDCTSLWNVQLYIEGGDFSLVRTCISNNRLFLLLVNRRVCCMMKDTFNTCYFFLE